jgi:hypothetical protein
MKRWIAIGLLAVLPFAASAQQPAGVPHPATAAPPCTPSIGLNFVCGLNQPEDLLQIGTSKWVIASGMGEGGGIAVIDTEAKAARRFFTGTAKPDRKMYPASTHTAWRFGLPRLQAPTHFIPSLTFRSKASRSSPSTPGEANLRSAGRGA